MMMMRLTTLSLLLLSFVSGSSIHGRVVSVVSPEELQDQDHHVSVVWNGKTSKDLHRYVRFFEFVIKNCVEMYVHVWNVLTYISYTQGIWKYIQVWKSKCSFTSLEFVSFRSGVEFRSR